MKVLLIGAGAVGQVYGYHFQRGGAEVAFYVRGRYAAATRAGFDLYPLNRKSPRAAPVRFEGFEVLTDWAAVAAGGFDIVVICVSSTALRKGGWLTELAGALGDATLVNLTPGIEDLVLITERVPFEQVVSGLIGLLSYPGPLPGETLPSPGMVYWVPPLTKMAFSGPEARTRGVVTALTRGGLRSKRVDDVQAAAAFAGPALQFLVVALELSGWRFAPLRRDKALLALASRATHEAHAVAAARFGGRRPFATRLARPWVLRWVTRLVPRVAPVDMELFFEKHFTKVGDQTEHGLRTLIRLADEYDLPRDAMTGLLARLVDHRER